MSQRTTVKSVNGLELVRDEEHADYRAFEIVDNDCGIICRIVHRVDFNNDMAWENAARSAFRDELHNRAEVA